MPARTFQPYLHDLVTQVSAPVVALSARSGQIAGGADGVYLGDRRLLSRLLVTFSGDEPSPVDAVPGSAAECEFLGVLRGHGDPGPDPTVFLTRRRALTGEGMTETVEVRSSAREVVSGRLRVRAGCDLSEMSTVKSGGQGSPLAATVDDRGWRWSAPDGTTVTLHASGATAGSRRGELGPDGLEWTVRLAPAERFTLTLTLRVEQPVPALGTPAKGGLPRVRVHGHPDLDRFVGRSIEDLDALVMADPEEPADRYVAAGAPWYLTLFGRDSLWTARMLLATGTELAGETLRVLARRQGTRDDPESAEQPGKIMHEFRTAPTEHHGGHGPATMSLPPLYYGTIDATPLWVLLLHDAWRWGLPDREVTALMPNAERAMSWVREAAASGQGFLSYRDESGHGLSNQGWKDSGDAIQFRDGRLAEAPIALCEVQGYAHQAALAYAALLDRFGGEGAGEWRAWAADLAERFRAAYWLQDEAGHYPATALDAAGQPVDTVTSNIGHLLGTGLLNAEEERLVVARLASPLMDSGFGLRTLAGDSQGFNPQSYHAGSVWTHDTAIAVMGLVASGSADADRVAASLMDGLVRAAQVFDYRMPELYGGQARADRAAPAPYPAACRPQAWSAASAVAALTAALGIEPDVPGGVVRFRPLRPWPLGRIRAEGLVVAGRRFDVTVDEDGRLSVDAQLDGLRLLVE